LTDFNVTVTESTEKQSHFFLKLPLPVHHLSVYNVIYILLYLCTFCFKTKRKQRAT